MSSERRSPRAHLARAGFVDLDEASAGLDELAELTGFDRERLVAGAALAADADESVRSLGAIARRDPGALRAAMAEPLSERRVWRLLGASQGFATFFLRHPGLLADAVEGERILPTADEMERALAESVGAADGIAAVTGEDAWNALRVAYRCVLARIAMVDLSSPEPVEAVRGVSRALADAAGAALEASLAVARARLSDARVPGSFSPEEVRDTRMAIIGMGKAGARELNYVSDVDVIFVGEPREGSDLSEARALEIATRLAVETMRGISSFETEPPLWEVDPNLRPEGRQGALVRTLASHLAYYARWAHSWEFQALLKARPLAGDRALGEDYVAGTQPLVWASASRDGFVDSVQEMRERVSDNVSSDEADRQIKLGRGGLRDIEFTVQLLQLVHGRADPSVRASGTLDALDQLVEGGYIGRADAATFATDYRLLRLLEHRLQLMPLTRTHLVPDSDEGRRVLARSTGLFDPSVDAAGGGSSDITTLWARVRQEVRDAHVRLFYRPLLSAVATMSPGDARALTGDEAHDRLAAIGFRNPTGALRHIGALTRGVSRKSTVQRTLMPVMLHWFADGVDPDQGLISYRRISERLGDSPWFLRVLRDSSGAAESLTTLLSGSRYVGELMEWIPESVAWLDSEEQMRPRSRDVLEFEARAIAKRRQSLDKAAQAIRGMRRRELLRTAMGAVLGSLTIKEVTTSISAITDVTLSAMLAAVRREVVPPEHDGLEFAIIGMGRYGGEEMGYGSDVDVMYVSRPGPVESSVADRLSRAIVSRLREVCEDARAPFDLDADLRPEGRKGPLVRTLDAYAAYYARWSVSWEAQALLRARAVAGSPDLGADFMRMADEVRYPSRAEETDVREIKRIKARVENERLPRGIDRTRHLKLGPGGLSDVEWLVQLIQLQHAHEVPELRTPRTLKALRAAYDAGFIGREDAQRLGAAWRLATRLRSANTLLAGRTSDVLPTGLHDLDGVGRILGRGPGAGAAVEEGWLRTARRARWSYEEIFYDL
ncbi:bifunctional [glutamine synthetase] adenylyltransferase/[glutamine synthetase]-adenylyl-L-tyrosine phosphorylase [Microbacterium sp. gxy059]|uniref:bifunctional [glutamine synthetase] adenylyltransferase/[glutamine synthetase]-adenylyl-L-tyrosine phosphorylase n=1 Tax=Microbacterium sp. gxy059 TaxID=2957199 RepID=UPI003D990DD1